MPQEVIFVGDVHAVAPELEECQRLLEFLEQVQFKHPVAKIVCLGDQFHTNDAMSVRVMEFWRHASIQLHSPCFLVGNHDQVHPGALQSAMSSCRDVATVVDTAYRLGPLWLVGYCGDALTLAARTDGEGGALVCHQDLAGFAYDSGFKSLSSMVPPERFVQVVSGHLHVPQELGRTWYPGSPRWRSLRDARVVERAVWWVRFSDEGHIEARIPYPTNGVCRRIATAQDSDGSAVNLVAGADNRVEVRGTADFVRRRRDELVAAGAQVRVVVERVEAPQVRESDGVEASLRGFIAGYQSPNGTPAPVLVDLVRQRLGLNL